MTITVTPPTLPPEGGQVTVSWNVAGSNAILNGQSVPSQGSMVETVTADKTYEITSTVTEVAAVDVQAPPPPVDDYVVLIGSGKMSLQFRIGPADRANLSTLQAAVAATQKWDLFATPDEQMSPSRNGVRVVQTVKIHPWGNMNGLYNQVARLKDDGTAPPAYPADDASGHTSDFAAAVKQLNVYGAHGGERGHSLLSGWVSTRGHTRRKADGTLSMSPHIPFSISVHLDGWIIYKFRDGRVQFVFKIPGAQATPDFTFFAPNRKLFFVSDALAKCIYKIDRTAGEDPAVWIVTTLATGFSKPVGIREVGGQLYVCDNGANMLIRVDPDTGAKTDVLSIPAVFWCDGRSDGTMWVATLQTRLHIFDPSTGVLGQNWMPQQSLRSWIYLSNDTNGTWGPKDECTIVAMNGSGNTDAWRYQDGAVVKHPWPRPYPNQGYGATTVGNTQFCHDVTGHYMWVGEHHPDEACIEFQGLANIFPSLMISRPDSYAAEDVYNHNAFRAGITILQFGTVPGIVYGTQPSFTCQVAETGWSLLGCHCDYMGSLTYQQLEDFLQAGGFGSFPRPEIKGRDLYNVGYIIYRSSLRFLREGKVLMDGWLAHCTPQFGQELPPVPQRLPATNTDIQMDVVVSGSNLVVKFSDKGGHPKTPEAGLIVRVLIDEAFPEELDLGLVGSPWTLPKPALPAGQHSARALPVSGVPDLAKYRGRATVI